MKFEPGSTIKLTEKFMRSTGTMRDKKLKWKVISCSCTLCELGNHCAVDEESSLVEHTMKHFHIGNVQLVSRKK